MNADHEFLGDCQEWHRLAETEGEAIRIRNWPLVVDCQKALERLQPQMSHRIQSAREEWKRLGLDCVEKERMVRALITELIDIETRNKTLLTTLQDNTRDTLHQLKKAGRTLRRVQNSYAHPQPGGWTSLS